MMTTKRANAARSHDFLGRYAGFTNASESHAPVIISTMMRNAKFFPVMNGKKSVLTTMNTMNGSAKIPASTIHRNIFSTMGRIVPCAARTTPDKTHDRHHPDRYDSCSNGRLSYSNTYYVPQPLQTITQACP